MEQHLDASQPAPLLVDGLDVPITRIVEEVQVVHELLALDDQQILELGCGAATHTRAIAAAGRGRRVLALDVDERQYERNLKMPGLDNLKFALGGAERIPAADQSQDVVFLFKSLHHVPVPSMARAMQEIARVVRPGGYAYVSEPLFRGDFNECLRLFHDESLVRREAFAAICNVVAEGRLRSISQTFFLAPVAFASFADFEQQVIGATHSNHVLSDELHAQVRERFHSFAGEHGVQFAQPIRVDLLQRPAGSRR